MSTVKDLINKLQSLKPELQDKEIYIVSENGLRLAPEIKFLLNDYSLDKTKENVIHIELV